jgi:thymidylate kinase
MNDNAISYRIRRPILISFSGLDGAGKTTQIENLRENISRLGLQHELITFWDDVVVGTRYREGFVHKVYGSEQGIGAPDKPVNRKDKNVRKWYLTVARHLLYLLDAVHLRFVVGRAEMNDNHVIIMDRYIYDELANLPIGNPLSNMFIRLVRFIVPKPDIAYLLDADPESARARKPEYPVDFMHKCRRAYFKLSRLLGTFTIIPPLPLTDAKHEVELAFTRMMEQAQHSETALEGAPAG